MPYISKEQRISIAEDGGLPTAVNVGELNYLITRLIVNYLPSNTRYADYNEVIGVLESAKLELYRRMVAPYENAALAMNGDVYDK